MDRNLISKIAVLYKLVGALVIFVGVAGVALFAYASFLVSGGIDSGTASVSGWEKGTDTFRDSIGFSIGLGYVAIGIALVALFLILLYSALDMLVDGLQEYKHGPDYKTVLFAERYNKAKELKLIK